MLFYMYYEEDQLTPVQTCHPRIQAQLSRDFKRECASLSFSVQACLPERQQLLLPLSPFIPIFILLPPLFYFLFCLFFFLSFFRATSAAYGNFQARGPVRAVAASLCHSHSNARFELHLQTTPQLTAKLNPWPTVWGQRSNLCPHGC